MQIVVQGRPTVILLISREQYARRKVDTSSSLQPRAACGRDLNSQTVCVLRIQEVRRRCSKKKNNKRKNNKAKQCHL